MKYWIYRNKLILLGFLLGALAGYGYYHFIGCSTGTCMITSKPLNSTLYFGFMGGLLFSAFKKNPGGDSK